MRRQLLLKFLTPILLCLLAITTVQAQSSSCPPNIDFSYGDFTNWECRTGYVANTGGQNTVSWSGNGQLGGRHELISPDDAQVDAFGGFPMHCPNTSSYSVKLGNNLGGHEAEGLVYTFTIPAGNNKFSLLYYYAVVMQNPSHQFYEQPRFRARVIDVATESEIDCVSFDFSSSGSLPGFQSSSMGNAVYKNWTPVSVDLSGFAGKTVRLEFISSDCVFQQHFGYAYVSVGSSCNGTISGAFRCDGDTLTTLVAPYGFNNYEWYSDAAFGGVISNQQVLNLNANVAPIGSTYPVVIHPYPSYGCLDTLYATIAPAFKPKANAGDDVTLCYKQTLRVGATPNPDYLYSWTPISSVNNPTLANPLVSPLLNTPSYLIVKTTDGETNCIAYDTVLVTPKVVDTATAHTAGKLIYCAGQSVSATFDYTGSASEMQWFRNATPISGAASPDYNAFNAGTYWAQVKQHGCIDTSRSYVIRYAARPTVDFIADKQVQCIDQPILFRSTTTIAGNEPLLYRWRFSDGTTQQGGNVEKRFSQIGNVTARLIITSGTDCLDSLQKTFLVMNQCAPFVPTGFTPNNDGKNDRFKPFLSGVKALKRFSVYNRYGNVVYTTAKEGPGWDGTYNGQQQETGVFIWVIEYTSYDGEPVVQKGTVTLIR